LSEQITTSGLVSGYQRTNVTTSGTLVESTDQSMFIPVIPLPSFNLPSFDNVRKSILSNIKKPTKDELMAQGYKALKKENKALAEELFPVDVDDWPNWEN
ncbi:hypothetical protein, partial [Macellibacteroides fermentans]|uniref:hypothetical protein n=1 Tax=Macellibacteroides fermentans TaxID=879969 RepID=UPI002B798173|nr:hypothetical protein [Macellibacteroides fermentans]